MTTKKLQSLLSTLDESLDGGARFAAAAELHAMPRDLAREVIALREENKLLQEGALAAFQRGYRDGREAEARAHDKTRAVAEKMAEALKRSHVAINASADQMDADFRGHDKRSEKASIRICAWEADKNAALDAYRALQGDQG